MNKIVDFNKKIIPYRFRQARISRGLSMAELADLIDVCKQAISQYELGKNEPSKLVLGRIANVLKYPVCFFYKPMPSCDNANSAVFFRKGKTAKVRALSAAREKIQIFKEINDYLSQYVEFPEVVFPKIEYCDEGIYPIDNETIEKYAMILRDYWGIGKGPINNLMNVVQRNGIMVSKMELRLDRCDAFSVWFNKTPFIFLSSDKDTNARIRFDIAHELGHLLMHADYYSEDDLKNHAINEKLENEANRFAGAFLMPKETFAQDVYSTSIDHFVQMKKKWKTSISSMIYRCEDLGILSQNQIKYLKDQMTAKVYWKREPLDSVMPVEKPFAHRQAITLILENEIIEPWKLVEDIGCTAEEIEQYCFLDKGTLSGNEDGNIIKLKF